MALRQNVISASLSFDKTVNPNTNNTHNFFYKRFTSRGTIRSNRRKAHDVASKQENEGLPYFNTSKRQNANNMTN